MCLCNRPTKTPAGVALLAGPQSSEVAQALAKSQSVKRLSATSRYLPNSVVPAEVEFPDDVKRLRQVGRLASDLGGSGFLASVEITHDPLRIQQQSVMEGIARNVPAVSALVYTPLDKLTATPATLQSFGTHLVGVPTRSEHTLGYLPRKHVDQAVARMTKELASSKLSGDVATMGSLMGKYLTTALNLNDNKGVYVQPRFPYDVVVQAARPAVAANSIEAALAGALAGNKKGLRALPPAAVCPTCLKGGNFAIIPKAAELDLCGNCIGRTVAHLQTHEQKQTLAGSNMVEYTYTPQEKRALNFNVENNRKGFPQGEVQGLDNCKAACDAQEDCTGFQYFPREDSCKYYSTRNTPEYFPYDSQFFESYEKRYAKLPKTYLQTNGQTPFGTMATPQQCSSNAQFRKPQTCQEVCDSKPDCMGFAFHNGCCQQYVKSDSRPKFEFSDGAEIYLKAGKKNLIGDYLPPAKTRPAAKKATCERPAREAARAASKAVTEAAAAVAASRVAGMAPSQ